MVHAVCLTSLPLSWQIQQTTNWWYFFLFYPENSFWHFMQIGSIYLTMSYFSQKTGFDISCKLSPFESICTKCQELFSGKNKIFFFQNVVCWRFYPECYALNKLEAHRSHSNNHTILYVPTYWDTLKLYLSKKCPKSFITQFYCLFLCPGVKNSIDPDQTPRSAAPDLGLNC